MSALPCETDGEFDEAGLDPNVLRRRREVVLTVLALALVLTAVAFAAYQVFRVPAPARSELMAIAEQAVRDALPPAYSLHFSPPEEARIAVVAEERYEVSSRVTATGRNGATEAYTFTCNVGRFGERRWRPVKLNLERQY